MSPATTILSGCNVFGEHLKCAQQLKKLAMLRNYICTFKLAAAVLKIIQILAQTKGNCFEKDSLMCESDLMGASLLKMPLAINTITQSIFRTNEKLMLTR